MGKKNIQKRRELEKLESISGNANKKLNRKQLNNLKEYGTLDGMEQVDLEGEGEGEMGKSYTFDQQGELIEEQDEEEDKGFEVLGNKFSAKDISLGSKSTNKKHRTSLNKLMGLLKRKKYKKEEVKEEEKAPVVVDEIEESENEEEEEIEEENGESENEIEEEVENISSEDEQETVKQIVNPYKLHYSEKHYNEKQISEIIKKIDKKEKHSYIIKEDENQIVLSSPIEINNLDKIKKEIQNNQINEYAIKPRLLPGFKKVNQAFTINEEQFSTIQTELFNLIDNYYDINYHLLDLKHLEEIRNIYILHCLNHINKVRDTIIKTNFKIAKNKEKGLETEDIKDSSFTRAKVLILVPFKSTALKVMQILFEVSGCEQFENKKRFYNEFEFPKDQIDPVATNKRLPEEHKLIFSGNTEDCFKLGIKLNRKNMKLYSPFYSSDIILASPLGLKLSDEQGDYDFLSSIEILIMDQLDHMCMQNIEHIHSILKRLNKVPTQSRDCDFSRVKSYYLNDQSSYFNQCILLSQMITPDIQSIANQYCKNVNGKIMFRKQEEQGILENILLSTQHTFLKINVNNPLEQHDNRFKYFKQNILPMIENKIRMEKKLLLFIDNYFDFVRIRNYLKQIQIDFGAISEYSTASEHTRQRHLFKDGKLSMLIYTERCHFYRRFKIQNIDEIIFYGLPQYAHYYKELIEMVSLDELKNQVKVISLFTRWDEMKLNRIIGTKKSRACIFGNRDKIIFS